MTVTGKSNRIKFALIAGFTACASLICIGSAYARSIDWASTEYIYIPSEKAAYNSDCLVPGDQQILLADWQPEETQRLVTIEIERPFVAVPETTVTGETTVSADTELESKTEPTETGTTEPSEPSETEPEETTEPVDPWPDTEVTVILDAVADAKLTCTAYVNETDIQLLLESREDAGVLQEATYATIHVEWYDLKGAFVIRFLPEVTAGSDETQETEPDHEVVTGLDPVMVNDTMNPEKPIACVKLNLNTLSDFTLTFLRNEKSLNKVRWSIDGGETYKLLYDSNTLSINYPYAADWDGTLFLDFGLCLDPDQRPTISVSATGYQLEEYTPVLQALPKAEQLVLKAAALPHVIQLTPTWGAAKLQLQSIQKLVADETGALVYQDDAFLSAEVTGRGIQVRSSDPTLLPSSGSYRMGIQWIWNETVVEERILYFFVNTN